MPKLFIIAKPKAKKTEVIKIDETHYRVSVKAPPDEGKANKAVIEALHEYFRRPRSAFALISGHKSRNKVVLLS